MTVRYLPVTNTAAIAAKDVNSDTTNSDMKAGGQAVSPRGSSSSRTKISSEEEDDDVDYYAHERKRKKHSLWGDRNAGVYNSSFPMKLWPINKWYSLILGTFLPMRDCILASLCLLIHVINSALNEFILILSVFMKIDQPEEVHWHIVCNTMQGFQIQSSL